MADSLHDLLGDQAALQRFLPVFEELAYDELDDILSMVIT